MIVRTGAAGDGIRVFSATSRYVQGPGALDRLGEHVRPVGSRCLVLIDEMMAPLLGDRITASLDSAGVVSAQATVNTEVTQAAIDDFARLEAAGSAEVVVGVGGGKTIDIAKGVARALGLPIVTVPTIASNDSPASRAIAMYDDDHQLVAVSLLDRNPACVVVDTAVIAQAPARFLSAGIGDALSKYAEAEACRVAGGVTMQGTWGLLVATIVARGCYEVLLAHAASAVASASAHRIDDALEATVEAVVLLSGLAFENGGLSIAHAMTRGFMAAPDAAGLLHGEHVAVGLLVQLALDRDDAEIEQTVEFLRSVGLPDSIAALGIEQTDAAVRTLVERAMTAPHAHNHPSEITPERLADALRRVWGPSR